MSFISTVIIDPNHTAVQGILDLEELPWVAALCACILTTVSATICPAVGPIDLFPIDSKSFRCT